MVSLNFIITITAAFIVGSITSILFLRFKSQTIDKSSEEINELFIYITEALHEFFFVISNDWKKVHYISPSWEKIYGKNRKKLYKSPFYWLKFIHPEDIEIVKYNLNEFVSDDTKTTFPDYRIIDQNGSVRWIATRIFHVKMNYNKTERILGIAEDITDRKISELELKSSEDNYRNIIKNIRDVFYRCDSEGNLIMASPSFRNTFGYDPEDDCTGINIAAQFYNNPEDRNKFMEILKEKGEILDYETTLRKKDGSPLIVSTSSHLYYDAMGNIAGVEGIIRDITERKRIENMFNKAFFDNPCSMSISDIETGFYIEVNKAWLESLEFEKSEVIGHTVHELKIYRDPVERNKIVEAIKTTGHAYNHDIEFITKKGNLRNAIFFGDVIDVAGKKMLLSSVLNVTKQREAEKLLKARNEELAKANEELMAVNEEFEASNEELLSTNFELTHAEEETGRLKNYLKNVIDSNPDILIVLDHKMKITLVNRTAEIATGISMNDATGLPVKDLLPDFAPSIESIRTEINRDDPITIHGFLLVKNGEKRYFDIVLYPLISSDGEGAVVRISDITGFMKNEEQLKQAQKMETVGNLAGGLAHDFNNVLSGIVGTTSLIKHIIENDTEFSSRLRNYIELIDKSGKRAAEMVQRLLTLTRRSEFTPVPFDLNNAIKNIIQICLNTFDKSVEINTQFCNSPAMIKGDQSQIEQVLLNLCINASHAMTIMRDKNSRQGGTLTLSIKNVIADKNLCTVHPEATSDKYWVVSHTDTGVGISSANLNRIFDPFFTTKEKNNGTGLGLAMVYNIVHQHGGFIEVYSETGTGSTFNIYLPEFSEENNYAISSDHNKIEKGDGLVLVIDDEEIVRIMAENFLMECGYDVISAGSGREGINIYKMRKDEIRCILLDMAMPGMSGIDVYTELKKINPGVKVLLTSGFRQDSRVQDAHLQGINGFIQKPYSITELSRQIKKII